MASTILVTISYSSTLDPPMKYHTRLTMFCAILLSVIGCEKKSPPVSVGPFDVNRDTGVATGEAFGIHFNVEGASLGETQSNLSGNPHYSSPAEITLGEDLKIKLETMNEGTSVAFQLNGRKFGSLGKGDEVVIDKARNVTVNGEKRPPQESQSK